MNLPKSIAVVIIALASSAATADVITVISNPSTGSTYYLLESATWEASQAEALSLGGNLVTINDADENAWILDTFTFYGGIYRDLWVGLNDDENEGEMVWVSGEPVTFTNWQPREPNNAGDVQDYVLMFAGPVGGHIAGWFPGGWDDASASNNPLSNYTMRNGDFRQIFGLVEINSVPEPSTLALLGIGLLGMGMSRRKKA